MWIKDRKSEFVVQYGASYRCVIGFMVPKLACNAAEKTQQAN